jgi:hypothetical protein
VPRLAFAAACVTAHAKQCSVTTSSLLLQAQQQQLLSAVYGGFVVCCCRYTSLHFALDGFSLVPCKHALQTRGAWTPPRFPLLLLVLLK